VKTGVLVIKPAVFVRLVIWSRVDDLAEKSYLFDRTENVIRDPEEVFSFAADAPLGRFIRRGIEIAGQPIAVCIDKP
jgi:hypothetical protein